MAPKLQILLIVIYAHLNIALLESVFNIAPRL